MTAIVLTKLSSLIRLRISGHLNCSLCSNFTSQLQSVYLKIFFGDVRNKLGNWKVHKFKRIMEWLKIRSNNARVKVLLNNLLFFPLFIERKMLVQITVSLKVLHPAESHVFSIQFPFPLSKSFVFVSETKPLKNKEGKDLQNYYKKVLLLFFLLF